MNADCRPRFVCLDLEGVLFPEIWSAVAAAWPDAAFLRTTRERADYAELCAERFGALGRLGLRWNELRELISGLEPLPGARAFLDGVRAAGPVAVVTDSFDAFVSLIAPKLGNPLVLCHRLNIDDSGRLASWTPRLPDSKARAAEAFRSLGYRVAAVGDGLNDLGMLAASDDAVLFRPSLECRAAADAAGFAYRTAEGYGGIFPGAGGGARLSED